MIVMRLLSSLKHDESERAIYHLSHKLIKDGHTSIVIASAEHTNKFVKKLKNDGNIYYRLPMVKKSWWSLLQVIPLRQYIEKYKPDIIHVHSRTPAWVLYWALKGARVRKKPKLVSTMYGFYPIKNYCKALLTVDAVITVSESVTQYLLEQIKNFPAKKRFSNIVLIYRGVDTRLHPYRYNPNVYWLRQIFIEFPELENKKWLLFPSIIGSEYGQEWLIDILGNLQEKFPNIHAIIMDDDRDNGEIVYEEFRQRAFALGLDNRMTFISSNRNDMREWLASANIVLALANNPESIGIPILQALHLGTPVIGWDKGAYSEILLKMYPQGLVKKHDAIAVSKAVRTQLQTLTRPTISSAFTLKETIKNTIQLYEMLNDDVEDIPFKL